jgi:CheY-like chemotaxis protein
VIFVGEIRDTETAQVAAQAALTGHLVLATLHTNDAVGSVARLADLGLDRATIAAALRGSAAQRLVRRVCPDCSQRVGGELSDDERRLGALYNATPVVRAIGCKRCGHTGYRGRLPVNEVFIVSPAIGEQIAVGATNLALQKLATAAGMRTLVEAAVERAAGGETTFSEIERVVGDPKDLKPAPARESTTMDAIEEAGAAAPVVDISGSKPIIDQLKANTEKAIPASAKIFVVDDDTVIRQLATATLMVAGFTVEAFEDGDQVLMKLGAGERCDLVLTDLQMARISGEALVRAMRSSAQSARVPIIVLTGAADAESEVTMMDAGADDYLRKPFDPLRLVSRVKAALRRSVIQ